MAQEVHADVPGERRLQGARSSRARPRASATSTTSPSTRSATRGRTRSRTRTSPIRSSRTSRSRWTRCARSCTCSPTRKGSMVGPITITDTGDTIDLRRHGLRRLGRALRSSRRTSSPSASTRPSTSCSSRRTRSGRASTRTSSGSATTASSSRAEASRRAACAGSCSGCTASSSCPSTCSVDNDPWGFYIYSVMKQGSINLAYESHAHGRAAMRASSACPRSTRTKYRLPEQRRDQDGRRRQQPRQADARLSLVQEGAAGSARSRRW